MRPAVADAVHEFWRARFGLTRQVVQRAIDRSEVAAGTEPDQVIEALIAPLYLRTLVTLEPTDEAYITAHVAFVAAAARTPDLDAPGG